MLEWPPSGIFETNVIVLITYSTISKKGLIPCVLKETTAATLISAIRLFHRWLVSKMRELFSVYYHEVLATSLKSSWSISYSLYDIDHIVCKIPWSFPSPLVSRFHSLIATILSHYSSGHVYVHQEQGSHEHSQPDTKYAVVLKGVLACYPKVNVRPADFLKWLR